VVHRFFIDPAALSREMPAAFPGPAGRLEGLWRPPRPGTDARGTAVVAHPHPAHGGTMLNKVVFHTARTLNHDLDVASLRFNFRGVGKSDGAYDGGNGETGDVAAAWAEARRRMPGLPLVAAGFSFGAAVTLRAAALPPPVEPPAVVVLIGTPLDLFTPPAPLPRDLPLVAVHGEHDQYTPPSRAREFAESWPGPAAFRMEPGADHFLEGGLVEATRFISDAVARWL
jgi:alpha/beta superfamily hydrolase